MYPYNNKNHQPQKSRKGRESRTSAKVTTMLKSEFTTRIGREATDEEYEFANAIYMEFDGDKDEFCREYIKTAKGKMYAAMSKMIRDQHEGIKSLTAKVGELTEELDNAQTLIETIEQNAQADMDGMRSSLGERFTIWHDALSHAEREECAQIHDEIRTYAIDYMGENNYLSYKISNHYDLTDADREAMVKALHK